jgi:hypothetical protein
LCPKKRFCDEKKEKYAETRQKKKRLLDYGFVLSLRLLAGGGGVVRVFSGDHPCKSLKRIIALENPVNRDHWAIVKVSP